MKIGLFALTGLGNFVFRGLQELNEDICILITRKEPGPYPHFNIPNLAKVARNSNVDTIELEHNDINWTSKVVVPELDMVLVATFHYKIPEHLYKNLQFRGYNIHPSILPNHCGPSPVFWALFNKDKDYGFSVHELTNKFDKGTIVYQKKIPLEANTLDKACVVLYKTIRKELKNILYNIKEGIKIPITGKYIYEPRPTELDFLYLNSLGKH